MGWAITLLWDELKTHLGVDAHHLLFVGGLCYTGGIVFFILGNFIPSLHAVWHLFCLAGTISHFISLYSFVLLGNTCLAKPLPQ